MRVTPVTRSPANQRAPNSKARNRLPSSAPPPCRRPPQRPRPRRPRSQIRVRHPPASQRAHLDPHQPEIQQTYVRLQNDLQALARKIGELESEADEHRRVAILHPRCARTDGITQSRSGDIGRGAGRRSRPQVLSPRWRRPR